MSDLLVRAARGERTERPPVWLMRQAGRYIPEYRDIREQYTFKEAIKNPEVAERITLLPWELFEPDGLVMFSDILTVLEPLGFDYRIESGVGPVVSNPVTDPGDVPTEFADVATEIDYVGDLLARLQSSIGDETSIIGFSGGPYTLASYVVGDEPTSRKPIRRFRTNHPEAFRDLLSMFTDVVEEYVRYQVEQGADVVQVFDTWAGVLTPDDYREFVLPLHQRIFDAIDVPSIVFARHPGGKLDLLAESGADVVGLDWTVDMADAREQLGDTPVQGNLDPSYLLGSPEFVKEKTHEVIEKAGDSGHILNLGHGIDRTTPVENATAFVDAAKEIER
ncbi:uroporphyrinogen decarboxylase [Haladaptatus paucihalophilus DX253]|uniref:Uroporphyrinogen decarboxylase n=1 Tax=Haladaptatus paucihalophilus DX253 TaxID=797209 RepID=E7QPI0_HALPU|nr:MULTISPECIES: uroporphyrinogen decarboxylase [Haladaptatus]EFW93463.1 uroporphyrinogen decarboxylase [Haladaptatus paucihalophilus DX253]GKZ15868.1 uroporphyrinogen decarboxylase [Haladaptatus sp. T7]SHL19892.1 uroporphyrinogen decarboxylase [Haladaptatus paucihalophilus DX253]